MADVINAGQEVEGTVANGVADIGNPLKIGGVAKSTVPTAVTDGQRTNAWFDLFGRLCTFEASSVLYDGTLSATTTGAALTTQAGISEVTVQNDPTNTDSILVGNSSSQSFRLGIGDSMTLRVINTNLVFVKAASGTQTVNWNARN